MIDQNSEPEERISTPEEVMEAYAKANQPKVNALIRRIQSKLMQQPNGVTVSLLEGDYPRIVDEVVRRYQEAGWYVTCGSDQRDGGWVTLAPATKEEKGSVQR